MKSVDLLEDIEQCELFQDLERDDLQLLLHYGRLRMFKAGEMMYKKDEHALGTFCLVLSGKVGIFAANKQLVKELGDGEILGEIGVVSPQKRRTVTVKALRPTETFEWNVDLIGAQVPELMGRLKALAWKNVSSYYV